jgi:hypothetical protein
MIEGEEGAEGGAVEAPAQPATELEPEPVPQYDAATTALMSIAASLSRLAEHYTPAPKA